jgi:hypothetical protein
MADFIGMAIVESEHHLSEDVSGLLLIEMTLGNDSVEQFSTVAKPLNNKILI